MEKETKDKIAETAAKIVANSKDAKFAKTLVAELKSQVRQEKEGGVELIVPTQEVEDVWDGESIRIVKTVRGYMFEIKGGISTFVDRRMTAVWECLDVLFALLKKDGRTPEEDTFCNAMCYAMESPLFCSLDQAILYETAAAMARTFNEYSQLLLEADLKPETEEDIEKNIQMEKDTAFVQAVAESSVPEVSED